jgi:hypothetical protein
MQEATSAKAIIKGLINSPKVFKTTVCMNFARGIYLTVKIALRELLNVLQRG